MQAAWNGSEVKLFWSRSIIELNSCSDREKLDCRGEEEVCPSTELPVFDSSHWRAFLQCLVMHNVFMKCKHPELLTELPCDMGCGIPSHQVSIFDLGSSNAKPESKGSIVWSDCTVMCAAKKPQMQNTWYRTKKKKNNNKKLYLGGVRKKAQDTGDLTKYEVDTMTIYTPKVMRPEWEHLENKIQLN